MINWFSYPFIRLLMPFIAGVAMASSIEPANTAGCVDLLWLSSIAFGFTLLILSFYNKRYSFRWVFGFVLNLQLILMGMLIVHIRDDDIDVRHISQLELSDSSKYVARVVDCPMQKERSVKMVLEIIGLKVKGGTSVNATGRVVTYMEKTESVSEIDYGDVILFYDRPEVVEPPKNPEQFDYREYLLRKGITHQIYLKDGRWMRLSMRVSNPIYEFSYWLRDNMLETMRRLGIDGDEYAVAAAILIGYDDVLSQDMRERYVTAGSMHILCVSGMHVGVIYLVFSYILFFLNKRKRWQLLLRQWILLLLIWTYALVAGLAPSILRATIMLSFVIIGEMIGRKGVITNSLAASAFLLLCINPSNLFDIGFILSYMAVLGIVVMQKPICNIIYVKNGFIGKIWELTAVSLAAQLATAPFSIFFFHQFPLYFWLSNLFMTPVSTAVIVGGFTMLMLSPIPYINIGVTWIVRWLVRIMNYIVSSIEDLPMSVIDGLYINDIEFVCLIVILLMTMLLITYKSKAFLYVIASMAIINCVSQLSRVIIQRNQQMFTVYSMTKGTAIDFVNGFDHVLLCDTTIFNDMSKADFCMKNNLIRQGVYGNPTNLLFETSDFDNLYMKKRGCFVSFGGKIIGFCDKMEYFDVKIHSKPYFDYFVVYGRNGIDLDKLCDSYMIDLLIIDSSISEFYRKIIIEKAEKHGIAYYDVKTSGAFVCKNF